MLEVSVRKRLPAFELAVDFALPTPGVVALFGPSGCGKTSTLNIIAGLLAPDTGRIRLDEELLLDTERRVRVAAERRRIGYAFQDARLFPHLSVAGNLRYGLKRATGTPFVSLEEVIALLDLAPLLTRRIHRLSGGERQRVAIGRALLAQPRLLLLDEPLASVDRERRAEVLPYLESLRDRLAVPMVYVSHEFEDVLRLATHVVLMQAGRVLAQGDIGQVSLDRRLRALVGAESVGAVIDGRVVGSDPVSGLTRVAVGHGELHLLAGSWADGTRVRVQLLAREVVVSRERVRLVSVRNHLAGTIVAIESEGAHSDLIFVDIGGATILARITRAATEELGLARGVAVWALIKSASLQSYVARSTR